MSPVLTIAIPTYKRPDLLRKCLESIFLQGEAEWLSVIVFDDSVTDINADVANWAAARYEGFRFVKNDGNLGIDANIEQCLNVVGSKYILVLGEDDVLLPGAVNFLKRLLEGSPFDIVFTSYVYVNNTLDKVIRSPFSVSGDVSPKDFVEKYLWAIGFIGGTVFSADFISRSSQRFLGTYFNHVGRLASVIDMGTKIFASPVPLVGNRSEDINSATWSSSYLVLNI